jgi:hypothetical protein
MKFNFRKIASALASSAMVGSTVALAAAANFPAPFVQNGAADVAIVYGSNLDLNAVVDISTALSSQLSGGGTAGPASTEAYPLFTSSSPLQLNTSLNSVRNTVTDSNLPMVLADGDFSGNVDAEITYQLTLGSNPRITFAKEPTSNDDPGLGILLSTARGNYLYNASINFDKTVNLSHVDSEGETINIFGQDFLISSAGDGTKLILFRAAQTLFLNVGGSSPNPSQTVTVGDDTYTVELVAATDTSATIRVTNSAGQTDQKEIDEAASKKILGVEVAVNLADESTATNSLQAEVIVGADRLTLQDDSEVKVGSDEDSIDGTWVDLTGTFPALTRMTIQGFAPDTSNDFIQEGGEFVDPVFGAFRVLFTELASNSAEDREDIEIKNSGSDKMEITFTDRNDDEAVGQEWLNNESNAGGKAFLGDSNDWPIAVRENALINKSGMAMVGNEDEGYWVRLKTLSNGTSGFSSDDVVFENVLDTGETWSASITAEGSGTITIGGKQYDVVYRYDKTGGASNAEFVQLNYPDSTGANEIVAYPTIETKKGAKLFFYEPLLINLSDANNKGKRGDGGAWENVTAIKIPDGDGYTDITVAATPASAGNQAALVYNYTITVGSGSATHVMTNASVGSNSADGLIGALRWNVTGGAQAPGGSANGAAPRSHVWLMLEDIDGTTITRPAVVLFEEQDESNNYEAVIIKAGGAGTTNSGTGVIDVDMTWNRDVDMAGSAQGAAGVQMESNDDMYVMMDQWGAVVNTDQSDSDQWISTVSYPDNQVTAMVYVDGLGAGGSSTTLGDVKVMDTELATSGMQSKNLVVVGGSCVNTAAATLAGSNAGCGASWTAATGAGSGEWIIHTQANPWASSKVATLVAGWEQADTANAATYLTTQTTSTAVGHKLKGTTSTTATVVTS